MSSVSKGFEVAFDWFFKIRKFHCTAVSGKCGSIAAHVDQFVTNRAAASAVGSAVSH
jgi:hypothetical protein